jgi:hypothetical protein
MVVKGLAGASVLPIRISIIKVRCKIKRKTQAVKLTNVYYVLNSRINLILINQLFKVKAIVNFSSQYCKIKTRDKILIITNKDGCWFFDTTLK